MKHLAAQKKQPTHRFPERTIRIGSLITQDAYTLNGALLLPAGSKVDNPRMLRRLQKPDVRFGPEKSSEIPLDLQVESELDEREHSKHITMCDLRERMQHAYALKQEVVKDLSSVFGRVSSDGTVDIPTVQSAVSTLLDETITDQSAMLSMVRLKDKDSYTFTHSVNVCILAIFLAIHSNHQERIDEIAMGALVHDIGKVRTPHFVLQKNGPLNPHEWHIMKQHPAVGTQLLSEYGEFSEIEISCVRDHHERLNGGGYPSGKSGNQISPYARITAIVDVYDALTTHRPYRKAMNPRDALLLMTQQMARNFDPRLLSIFVSAVGYFPIGSVVTLNNGITGVVIENHPSEPLRPTVAVCRDCRGKDTDYTLDLRENAGVFIKKFINERTAVDIALDKAA